MAQRLRLYDYRYSGIPETVGICADDLPSVAAIANAAQSRAIFAKEAGDEGWWGSWAEIAFTVNRSNPYWTGTRDIARLESANVCQHPVPINNQFVEYLRFGNGRLPKQFKSCREFNLEIYTRNVVPTQVDLVPGSLVWVYITESGDAGKRIFFEGVDTHGNPLSSVDASVPVKGMFLNLAKPNAVLPLALNSITGIQKDVTIGQVQIFMVDPLTAAQTLILTMQGGETVAGYRRYYFHNLPANCCFSAAASVPVNTNNNLTVTAIAKLELIPVVSNTDYLLIQNLEAMRELSQEVRYSKMDTLAAKQMAAVHHKNAIGLLNGELAHYLGIDTPAINFKPFGSATLARKRIGTLV